MTSLESYGLTPADDLGRHLLDIDAQRQNALDLYNGLTAQREIVMQALGIEAVESAVVLDAEVAPESSAVA